MDQPTTPEDPAATGRLTRPRDAALGILFAVGLLLTLTRDDMRPLGGLLMVVSAVVFLAATVVRQRQRRPGR
jgi:hypothetical protein